MESAKDIDSRLLIIYTGGSIGIHLPELRVATPEGHRPSEGNLQSILRSMPQFCDPVYTSQKESCSGAQVYEHKQAEFVTPITKFGRRIHYDVLPFTPLVDSCNMDMTHWARIATLIFEKYDIYDAFVVLLGTDTMAYCASALSFMLDNLTKTVILTGSQVPMAEQYNDGVLNLLGAMIFAGHYVIPEVTVYFDNKLYRGNRTTKTHASSFAAFDSPNLPPLGNMGVTISVDWDAILRPRGGKLRVRTAINTNVGVLRLFPGITLETVQTFLQPPMETYGAGNGPSNRKDLIEAFKAACESGVLLVNCTQCLRGYVTDAYQTGRVLSEAGIVPGFDMTPEAALTKLSYVLGLEGLTIDRRRALMRQNLRGEMMASKTQDGFSLHNALFVSTLADVVLEDKNTNSMSSGLVPIVGCCAARLGDISLLQRMSEQNVNLSTGDYDSRTALHMAAAEGQARTVEYLLQREVAVNAVDRHGKTSLHDAAAAGHVEVVEILRARGGTIAMAGVRLAEALVTLVLHKNMQALRCFLAAGVDVNLRNYNGRTLLHWAVAEDFEELELVLRSQEGIDTSATDLDGCTAEQLRP